MFFRYGLSSPIQGRAAGHTRARRRSPPRSDPLPRSRLPAPGRSPPHPPSGTAPAYQALRFPRRCAPSRLQQVDQRDREPGTGEVVRAGAADAARATGDDRNPLRRPAHRNGLCAVGGIRRSTSIGRSFRRGVTGRFFQNRTLRHKVAGFPWSRPSPRLSAAPDPRGGANRNRRIFRLPAHALHFVRGRPK